MKSSVLAATAIYPKTLAIFVSVGIFVIDLFAQASIAIGVLYLLALSLIISQSRRTIFLFSCFSSVLIVIDLWLLHFTVTAGWPQILGNKIITLLAIWIACSVLIRYRSLQERKEQQKEEHLKAVEEMLFITSHKVRKPVSSIRGLVNLFECTPSQEDVEKIMGYIKSSAQELDEFTRQLTRFIHEESQKK